MLYDDVAAPIVNSCLKGFNGMDSTSGVGFGAHCTVVPKGTIFAYGQTGVGLSVLHLGRT